MKVSFRPQNGFYGEIFLNLFFIFVTLGIYLPWGVTNIRRLVWSNTTLKDHRFYYLGQASEIVKGYLVLGGLYLISRIFSFIAETYSQNIALSIAFSIPASNVFVTLIYKAQLGSFRYQAHRTVFTGIRFKADLPGIRKQYLECLKMAFITVILLGIPYLYFYFKIEKMKYNSLQFGEEKFSFTLNFRQYASVYFRHSLIFLFLIFAGSFGAYFVRQAGFVPDLFFGIMSGLLAGIVGVTTFLHMLYSLFLLKINHLKTPNLTFSTDLRFFDFFASNLVNIPILIFSLGLALPIVIARNIGVYANSVDVQGIESLETISFPEESKSNLEEFVSHNFDLDILDVF